MKGEIAPGMWKVIELALMIVMFSLLLVIATSLPHAAPNIVIGT